MAKQTVGELVYRITGDSKGLGASLAKADAQVQGLGKSFNKLNKSVAVLTGVGVAVAALGTTLVAATAKAVQFETRIGNIQTLVGDNTQEIEKLRSGILKLTRTIPRNADELGAAAYDILSAGITDASDALSVLEASGKLAVAGLGTTKEAVNLVTSAINAFKIPASEANQVAATVFSTVAAGKTTVAELAQAFGNVAAAAQGAGISFEETQAATAALTTVGFRTATAQERLRALFDELTRSSGKLSESIEELGIENIGATLKTDGFKKVLDDLLESVNGDTIAFKNMFSSIEAGGAALALVTGASETYNQTLEAMGTNAETLEKAFATQADTTANRLTLAQNQLNEAMIEFGTNVLPTVNAALEKTISFFFGARNATQEYIDELERLGAQSELVAGAIKEARDGTRELTDEQKQGALAALDLERKIADNERALAAYNDAQDNGIVGAIRNRGILKDLGFSLRDLNTAYREGEGENAKYVTGVERLRQETEDLKKELEDYEGSLEEVLEPARQLKEETDNLATNIQKNEEAMREAEQAAKKAAQELESFQGQMVSLIEASVNTRKELEENLTDAFKNFGDSISGSFAETNEELANIVLNAEERIKQLKKDVKDTEDKDRRKELRAEIKQQEEILKAREDFEERQAQKLTEIRERLAEAGIDEERIKGLTDIQTLEERITEQRRINDLDEFSRFEELQFKKLDKLTTDFITEVGLVENKIAKQIDLEEDLTSFLQQTTAVRVSEVDQWAIRTIQRHQEVAASLRRLISVQSQVQRVTSGSSRQFHEGGFVGAGGGTVHAGEYVIPARLVSRFGSAVSSLERVRQGGSVDNSRTVNAPINMNNTIAEEVDFRAIGRELAWELGRR